MIELAGALRAVVEALESADVGYVVVGSTAAAAWGVVRTTRDVDIVVMVSEDDLDQVLDSIRADGLYVPEAAARDAVLHGGSFNVLDPSNGGKVDVFVNDCDDAFTGSRIERRIRSEVFDVACWVATAEDVVLGKLRWRRQSRSEIQWRDCAEIAASNDLDLGYLRTWGADLGVTDDLEELIEATGRATK